MSGPEITFRLNGTFHTEGDPTVLETGKYQARLKEGKIFITGENKELLISDFAIIFPTNSHCVFELIDVTIGIQFHWERKENQRFNGSLLFIIEKNQITAINSIHLEDYLTSVISSEMSATSSEELLKAHAVISRSWLIAQIDKAKQLKKKQQQPEITIQTEEELVRWYDREDHLNFDVCADDHCQRYQGITKETTPAAEAAIKATRGLVLMHGGEICDARFSKSCGGVSELFENTWEPVNHPYLQKVIDNPTQPEGYDLNLCEESAADRWIRSNPPAFCNTHDKKILSQVLNDYDQETNDFYRWKVSYTQQELSELIHQRTEINFGSIIDLIPIERGVSGRLIRLKIIGTLKTMIIGKELVIRKALSSTHLYSSAFVVDKEGIKDGIPEKFILTGAGWGHGVGLCQIGAAVMGAHGYSYSEILMHYFKGATLEKQYL